MIVIDAFYADSIPFHLATREFLELVRERLAPGGVVVVNVIGALHGRRVEAAALADEDVPVGRSRPCSSIRSTTRSTTTNPTYTRNVILVATDAAAPSHGVPAAALAGDQARRAGGSRSRPRDRATAGTRPVPLRRRARADGRLRADRRAADRLRTG